MCCLVLRSNFALLLTIQFALLLDQSSGDRSSVAYRATENLSRCKLGKRSLVSADAIRMLSQETLKNFITKVNEIGQYPLGVKLGLPLEVPFGAALASNFLACAALLVYFRVTAVLAEDLEDVWELPSW